MQRESNKAQQESINDLKSSVALDKSRGYKVTGPTVNTTVTTASSEAFCKDNNDTLLSGGFTSTADKKMHIASSGPGSETTGISSWVVEGFGEAPNGYAFQAFANCYRID